MPNLKQTKSNSLPSPQLPVSMERNYTTTSTMNNKNNNAWLGGKGYSLAIVQVIKT